GKDLVAHRVIDTSRIQRLRSNVSSRRRDSAQRFWISSVLLMSDVTRILSAIEQGDPRAADQLLPLIYDELRKLAASNLAQEKPGQALKATALVHEASLGMVESERRGSFPVHWNSRGHFFAAAAEAMRRILIERARSCHRLRRGGRRHRRDLDRLD